MIKLLQRTVDNSVPLERLPAEAGISFVRGDALKLVGGVLAKVTSTDVIDFISEETKTAAEGDLLTVTRVVADGTYESELAADAESIEIGGKYAVNDSLVGEASETGHLRVLYAEGTTAGSKVRFNIV